MQVKGPLSFLCYSNNTWYMSCIMTFQHLTVSCSKVPDIDCSWHFMVFYLVKTPIISMHVIIFPGRNNISCS